MKDVIGIPLALKVNSLVRELFSPANVFHVEKKCIPTKRKLEVFLFYTFLFLLE